MGLKSDNKRGQSSDYIDLSKKALSKFKVEKIQAFKSEEVIECQRLMGHGDVYGVWSTPEAMIGRRLSPACANIAIRDKVISNLPYDYQPSPKLYQLLNEAELWISRYGLILRSSPASLKIRRYGYLDPSTISGILYKTIPPIISLGIQRRMEGSSENNGFVSALSVQDIRHLESLSLGNIAELNRLRKLSDMGLWVDGPCISTVEPTLDPRGELNIRSKEYIRNPYQPFPDDWLGEIGPKVIWLIETLGPVILRLASELATLASSCKSSEFPDKAMHYLKRNNDASVVDGYQFYLGPVNFKKGEGGVDFSRIAWPPVILDNFYNAVGALQAAHGWIMFLALGGRYEEILTLFRDCVEQSDEGNYSVKGKTYKLSKVFSGEERNWPIPQLLLDCIVQQASLGQICESIAVNRGLLVQPLDHPWLWIKHSTHGKGPVGQQLSSLNVPMNYLAIRLGSNCRPGGIAIHSHRFRKTIARIAAIAITDSPRVLMQLFGHKHIDMTLTYILTDKNLQDEISKVARELRVLRCQDIVESLHESDNTPGIWPYAGYGGGAMPGILASVKSKEESLKREGNDWTAESAYELASLLSLNGEGFRVIRPGVICTKPLKQLAPCVCDSNCIHRIEDKVARRDTDGVIEYLIQLGGRALRENNLLLIESLVCQIKCELKKFQDIGEKWSDNEIYNKLNLALE
jgi:hypothetical protein